MELRWHNLAQTLAFATVLLGLGCSSSHPPRCAAEKTCFAADALGCCGGGGVTVSICEACPAGMIERADCRTTGCVDPCETPLNCVADLGAGCCGAPVFSESCDVCPPGSRPSAECAAGFVPSCGCAEATLLPPEDGEDAEAPARIAPRNCFEDFGEGCCGNAVAMEGECGCPDGTLLEFDCANFVGDRIADPVPLEDCRMNFGEGCCGEIVARNACSFECPAGSVPASTCDRVRGGGAEPPIEPAPDPDDPDAGVPAPPDLIAPCYEVLADGCCGPVVEIDWCTGVCPEGSSTDCMFGGSCGV